jgi:hypothetical protein
MSPTLPMNPASRQNVLSSDREDQGDFFCLGKSRTLTNQNDPVTRIINPNINAPFRKLAAAFPVTA